MNRLIEIRLYKLKAGEGSAFHRVVVEQGIPLLRQWGTEVVTCGLSTHEPDAYFLVRSYESLADRTARQEAVYGSEAWLTGPREALVGRIESHLNTLLWLSDSAVESMRTLNPISAPSPT